MGKTYQEVLMIHAVTHPRAGLFAFGLCAALALPAFAQVTSGGANAEPKSSIQRRATGIDRSGNYQQEVQACRSGKTAQSRETCLEEARNAQAERRRGQLGKGGDDYTANALARCQSLTGEDLQACRARVMASGSTSGSVAGGGLLRQVETVVPPGADNEPKTQKPGIVVPAPSK